MRPLLRLDGFVRDKLSGRYGDYLGTAGYPLTHGLARPTSCPPLSRTCASTYPPRTSPFRSKFYAALGFRQAEAWDNAVDCELGGHEFRLQNEYVRAWADNCMMILDVDDVPAWHAHVEAVLAGNGSPGARCTPPESAGDSLVPHVWDPSGVLLVFVQ